MQHSPHVLPLLLAAVALPAQTTTVVPSLLATAEGNTSLTVPFGTSGVYRIQEIYARRLIAVPSLTITRLGVRPNGGSASAAKNNVDLEIRMSTGTVDPYRPSTTYANNHGNTVTTVYTRKLTNLPALASAPGPAPFTAQFTFDVPFPYQTAPGHLVIDYLVHGQVAGSYTLDAHTSIAGQVTSIGTGCSGTSQTVSGSQIAQDGSSLTFNLAGAIPNGQSVHLLGVTQLPTPIPLPLGGCLLRQDFFLTTVRPVSASGAASLSYPLSYNYFNGEFLGQYIAVDAALTQMVATESERVRLGGFQPMSRIYGASVTANTGSVQEGVALVHQLTY